MTTLIHVSQPHVPTIVQLAESACERLTHVNTQTLLKHAGLHPENYNVCNHNHTEHQHTSLIMTARTLSETIPEYDIVASRLLLNRLSNEVYRSLAEPHSTPQPKSHPPQLSQQHYQRGFISYICKGIERGFIRPEIIAYDLTYLAEKITPSHDSNLTYVELQSLSSRLLMRHNGLCFELPQYAFMRIAIALAIKENKNEARAADIYRLLSVRSYSRISTKTFCEGALFPHPNPTTATYRLRQVDRNKRPHLKLIN